MAAKTKYKLNCGCQLNTNPFQWWIQGRGPGGTPPSPPPPYFWTKLRPEQPKKFFSETSPSSPYLKVWMTGLPLISGSGSGTAFEPGTKHLIGGGNKMYHCNCTAVKTSRLRFLGKLFLRYIPVRRLYLVRLSGTLVLPVFIFHKTCMLGTLDSQF